MGIDHEPSVEDSRRKNAIGAWGFGALLLVFGATQIAMFGNIERFSPSIAVAISAIAIAIGSMVLRTTNDSWISTQSVYLGFIAAWYLPACIVYLTMPEYIANRHFYTDNVEYSFWILAGGITATCFGVAAAEFLPFSECTSRGFDSRTTICCLALTLLGLLAASLSVPYSWQLRGVDFSAYYEEQGMRGGNAAGALVRFWGYCSAATFAYFLTHDRRWWIALTVVGLPCLAAYLLFTGKRMALFITFIAHVAVLIPLRRDLARRYLLVLAPVMVVVLVAMHYFRMQGKFDLREALLHPATYTASSISVIDRSFSVFGDRQPLLGETVTASLPNLLPPLIGNKLIKTDSNPVMRVPRETIKGSYKTKFGMGGSFIAEAYINFGLCFPLALSLWGVVCGYFLRWTKTIDTTAWKIALCVVVVPAIFYQVRGWSFELFSYVSYLWILVPICLLPALIRGRTTDG